MNRSDLVRELAARGGLPEARARLVIDVLFGSAGAIADALDRGERVSIAGFGTFGVRERASRLAHDPRSGTPRPVPARRVPCFRPGTCLRDRVR